MCDCPGPGNHTPFGGDIELLNRSSAGNEVHDHHDQRNYKQEMDQRACYMEPPP